MITRPDIVLEFILSSPGLQEMCEVMPEYAAEYAPQLTIPGFGGELEDAFEQAYRRSNHKDQWSLRHSALGHPVEATSVAWDYFHSGIFGPHVSPYDDADHLMWLLSADSGWMPPSIHETLLDGLARYDRGWGWPGAAADALRRARRSGKYRWTAKVRDDWQERIEQAINRLRLPESVDILFGRVQSQSVIERAMQGKETSHKGGRG